MKIVHINKGKIRREALQDQLQREMRTHLISLAKKSARRKMEQLLKQSTNTI